jgi:hypothetical protein
MADIDVDITETDLETQENDLETQENDLETQENELETVLEEELIEQPIKKKPGRPKGAVNKGPSKPRPKRKVVIVEEPLETEEEALPISHVQQRDQYQRPLPTEPTDELSELLLSVLNRHQNKRVRRKTEQRRSWFA